MLLGKFKQGKEIDFVKGIQKYISQHFGKKHLKFRGNQVLKN